MPPKRRSVLTEKSLNSPSRSSPRSQKKLLEKPTGIFFHYELIKKPIIYCVLSKIETLKRPLIPQLKFPNSFFPKLYKFKYIGLGTKVPSDIFL